MNLKDIQGIIKDFEMSSLTTLELEMDTFKLKLSKLHTSPKSTVSEAVIALENPGLLTTPASATCVPIKSPLVGTYYASATPAGEPFVQVGQAVKKGQTVCIIEAMKIMNEISTPVAGTIERIDVKNGQVVGFDQVLITIHTGEGHGE